MPHLPLLRRDGTVVGWTTVDEVDAGALGVFRWYRHARGYAARSEGGRTVLMHRQIMGFPPAGVDHYDLDKLNNSRGNLRLATQLQNGQNLPVRAGGSSRFRGVTWDRTSRKWVAQVKSDGKLYRGARHGLGSFDSEDAAAAAAARFRAEHLPFAVER